MNELYPLAYNIVMAENRFIDAVMEQFDKTQLEAEKILSVFQAEKIVLIDPVMGSFTLSQGLFWEQDVMDTALTL
ncbi:MAG: hypothetical protein GY743_23365 [Planctomycetaceae bacterium]|nr:hypothetical protein [Planctomycetaceae bacterium]